MASITDQTKWRRVLNHVAADLKAVIDIAAGQSVEVTQATATDLEALVTLKGLRGIIPNPIEAARIYRSLTQTGAGAGEIYDVGVATKLFIDSVWLGSREAAAVSSSAYIRIVDGEDAFQFDLLSHYYDVAGHQTSSNQYLRAIEIPAEWRVLLYSEHANIDAVGGIHGWIEDV